MLDKLKIISGGQTGVDRAALDFAMENSVPAGGYCTKDRRAENGTIPEIYPLTELESREYRRRTEANVLESDGTLIFVWKISSGQGSQSTIMFCEKHQKPYRVCNIDELSDINNYCDLHQWLVRNEIKILNIAGNRESEDPGIYKKTIEALNLLFKL
jgi:hypothetical protein